MKYRKKPVVIEAIKWTGDNVDEIVSFYMESKNGSPDGRPLQTHTPEKGQLVIPTLEGDHIAKKGDFIIRGVKGELYPCKPDIFEQTYKKVEE